MKVVNSILLLLGIKNAYSLIPTWQALGYYRHLKPGKLMKIEHQDQIMLMFRELDGDSVNLICPYHGFEFKDNKLVNVCGVNDKLKTKEILDNYPIYKKENYYKHDLVYGAPNINCLDRNAEKKRKFLDILGKPFQEVEAYDPTYSVSTGSIDINANIKIAIENILDMLHISYVHDFGNRMDPYPYKIDNNFKPKIPKTWNPELCDGTTFYYKAGGNSIFKKYFAAKEVVVDNFFYFPYTAVSRVRTDDTVKILNYSRNSRMRCFITLFFLWFKKCFNMK